MAIESLSFSMRRRRIADLATDLLRRNGWGVADQVLISATNFITMILIARELSPAAFGAFTLGYSALLFANSVQSSLITQPLSVLSATNSGQDSAGFVTTTATSQICLAIGLAIIAWGAAAIAYAAGGGVADLLLALGPAILAWQSQEFVRRLLYVQERLGAAFLNDVISYGGQAIVVVVLWWREALTGPAAVYALAATSALAVVFGMRQLRGSFGRRLDFGVVIENWNFGKWLGGAELLRWLSSGHMYQYLAALILGTTATGTLRAAEIVFGPTRVLTFYLNTVLPTRFSRTFATDGHAGLRGQLKLTYAVIVPLVGSYCLLIALLAGPLLRLLYGDNYVGGSSVLALYALSAFLGYQMQIVSAALRAKRLTRPIFVTYVYTSVITLSSGWLLILLLGVKGGIVGMIMTSLVATVRFWRVFNQDLLATPGRANV